MITDTDHYAPGKGDALWAWKSFLRGHNPILMDFGIIDVVHPLDPSLGVPPYEAFDGARYAMGDTRRYGARVRLTDMTPRGDLTSTGYALVNPGEEYLILEPREAGSFSVRLALGTYSVEWYSVHTRETKSGANTVAERDGPIDFVSPFGPAPSVLYLKRIAR